MSTLLSMGRESRRCSKTTGARMVTSARRSPATGGCERSRSWDAVRAILFLLCIVPVFGSDAPPTNNHTSGFTNFIQAIPGSTASFDMIAILGGEITCGSPPNEPGRDLHDQPQRKVKVRPFWLGKHEVTWQEYLQYAHLANSEIASFRPDTRVPIDHDGITHPSRFYGAADRGRGDGNYPVIGMGWIAASEYCRWLGKKTGKPFRLPTEDEWEYACRAFSTPVAQLRGAARMIETPEWDELDPEFPHSPWWLTADFVGLRVALDAEATAVNPRPVPTNETGQ